MSDIKAYDWGLGSQPGFDNVIAFVPFSGTVEVGGTPVSHVEDGPFSVDSAAHGPDLTKVSICSESMVAI
jgi:hypothetical protein